VIWCNQVVVPPFHAGCINWKNCTLFGTVFIPCIS